MKNKKTIFSAVILATLLIQPASAQGANQQEATRWHAAVQEGLNAFKVSSQQKLDQIKKSRAVSAGVKLAQKPLTWAALGATTLICYFAFGRNLVTPLPESEITPRIKTIDGLQGLIQKYSDKPEIVEVAAQLTEILKKIKLCEMGIKACKGMAELSEGYDQEIFQGTAQIFQETLAKKVELEAALFALIKKHSKPRSRRPSCIGDVFTSPDEQENN